MYDGMMDDWSIQHISDYPSIHNSEEFIFILKMDQLIRTVTTQYKYPKEHCIFLINISFQMKMECIQLN